MNFYIRIICLSIASLIATPALSQGVSDWSDTTVCRLVESDGGALYIEEATSRGLDCKASIKASEAKPTKSKSDRSFGINTYGGEGYILENESPNFDSLRWSLYRKLHYRPLRGHRFYSVQASNPSNFEFDLRDDMYIKQQLNTTPLLSYLLFEDGKIVIDEITPKDRFGDMFTGSSVYHSMSMGKSITSYLTGHAICEGKIKSVDSRLDWPMLKGTLYHNQKIINLLNMASGDKAYSQNDESTLSIQSRMATEFKGSKKSNHQYYYTNLNTNLVLSYLLFTYGDDDFKRLFDDVFQKKAGIRNEVFLTKTSGAKKHEKSLGHQFFATRYDYLRIAKAMLDDWQNDTCVGKYLKTIHDRRIKKGASWAASHDLTSRVGLPHSYGGFFHTGYKGMKNRPVMGMDGNGGQTILIDFERGRIVATLAVFDNMKFPKKASFDFKKIAYEKIKNGKPSAKTITTKSTESVIDPQELVLYNKARRESDKKAKAYWDDYYDMIFWGASADGSTLFSEDFESASQRDIRVNDRNNKWYIKQDNDGNSIYCNKVTAGWTEFKFGNEHWSDYSISYRMKFSAGKGGMTETHIRKTHGSDYRVNFSSFGGVEIRLTKNGRPRASGYVSTKTGEWLDIQLTASGDNIEYLVDGEVIASATDDRVKKGSGFFAVSANSEVCMDDIVVNKI